jgi:lipopolysaccharide heptosyltransferase II
MKTFDRIFGPLLIQTLSSPKGKKDSIPKSFLLIRPGGIGDAVLLIPAINALKDKYPDAKITILAEKRNGAVFSMCPAVDRLHLYDRPKELLAAIRGNYDVVIDTEQWHRLSAIVARLTGAPVSIGFATNERKRLFTHPVPYSHDAYEMESFINLLLPLEIEGPTEFSVPFIIIPESVKRKGEEFLKPINQYRFVSIFPGASIPERRWGEGKYREVAARLNAAGVPVVVVGGKTDRPDGEEIIAGQYGLNLAGRTSLTETAAIIDRSSLLLSGDSGILHIGVGLGKPTVALFGPGIAKKWAPRGDKDIVVDKRFHCSPCTRFGYTPKCSINARCLDEISVDEVLQAVESMLVMQKFIDNSDGKLI